MVKEYREAIKVVDGKEYKVKIRQVNEPNIDLMIKGIMIATKEKSTGN